jgi:hypothetical protein
MNPSNNTQYPLSGMEPNDHLFCIPCEGETLQVNNTSKPKSSSGFLKHIFRRNKNKNTVDEHSPREVSPDKSKKKKTKKKVKDEWKAAIQADTGRVYYYHTTTKETTWIRPESFVLWKMIMDESTKRPYFVNQITKETTWDVPYDFDPWKSYVDSDTRKTYYHNVLTDETTWKKPTPFASVNEEVTNVHIDEEEVNTPSTLISISSSESVESVRKEEELETVHNETDTADLMPQSICLPEHFSDLENEVEEAEDEYEVEIESVVDSVEDENPNSTRLRYLLSKYAPGNGEINKALIEKCKGHEGHVVMDLERIITDIPFDEVHIAFHNYAMSALDRSYSDPIDKYSTGDTEIEPEPTVLNDPTENTTAVNHKSRSRSNSSKNSASYHNMSGEDIIACDEKFQDSKSGSKKSHSDRETLERQFLWPSESNETIPSVSYIYNDGLNRIRRKPVGMSSKECNIATESSSDDGSIHDLTDSYRSRRLRYYSR